MDIVLFAFEDDAADKLPQRIIVTIPELAKHLL